MADPKEVLYAIYGDDIGVNGNRFVVNVRDNDLLIGTIGFEVDASGCVKLLDIRFEADIQSSQRRELIGRCKPHFAHVDDVFASISTTADRMRETVAATAAAIQPSDATEGDTGTHSTILLKLDHMRQRAQYSQTIVDWCRSLGLLGALIFQEEGKEHPMPVVHKGSKPLILILIHGSTASIREYLRLHRTSTVDVDSTCRRCKEKMLENIWKQPALHSSCCDTVEAGLAHLFPDGGRQCGRFSIAHVPSRQTLYQHLTEYLHYTSPQQTHTWPWEWPTLLREKASTECPRLRLMRSCIAGGYTGEVLVTHSRLRIHECTVIDWTRMDGLSHRTSLTSSSPLS